MRANTITAEIEVPQTGAETQRPVQPTLKIAAIAFRRNSKGKRILAGGVEHDHCP
jgi:hypothetical protein